MKSRNATFWIHWEESWEVTHPFLWNALAVMTYTSVDQLEFTHNWLKNGFDIDLHKTGRTVDKILDVNTDFAQIPRRQGDGGGGGGGEEGSDDDDNDDDIHNDDNMVTDMMSKKKKKVSYVSILNDFKNPSDDPECFTEHNLFQRDQSWPLFSLRPGIDRVKTILSTGYFDEDAELWPWKFEMIYAGRWYCLHRGKKVCIHLKKKK